MMYNTKLAVVLFAASAVAVAEPEPIWNPFTYIFGSKSTTLSTIPVPQQTHHISGFTIQPPRMTGTGSVVPMQTMAQPGRSIDVTFHKIPGPMEQVLSTSFTAGSAAQPSATGLWQHAKIGVTNLGHNIENEAVDVGQGIKHGAENVGQGIKHGAQAAETKVAGVFNKRHRGPPRPAREHGPVPIINRRAGASLTVTVPSKAPVPPATHAPIASAADSIQRARINKRAGASLTVTVPAKAPVPPPTHAAAADSIQRAKINKRGLFWWAASNPTPTTFATVTSSRIASASPSTVRVASTTPTPSSLRIASASPSTVRASSVAPAVPTAAGLAVAAAPSPARAAATPAAAASSAAAPFGGILRVKITRRTPRDNFRSKLAKKALAMPDY